MAFKLINYDLCNRDLYLELAQNTIRLLKENKTVCLFTMGKERSYFLEIIASEYLNIDLQKISLNKLTDEEKERIKQFEYKLNTDFQNKLFIFDDNSYSIKQIDRYLTALIAENIKPDLVVIDDIVFIKFMGKLKDLYNQLNDLQNKFDVKVVAFQEKNLMELAMSLY